MSQVVQLILLYLSVTLLSSCAFDYQKIIEEGGIPDIITKTSSVLELQSEELKNILPAKRKPVIAIYPNSFKDQTGQRKSNGQFALFSTAITQAPEAFLIRALKHAADGKFFQVAERVGLDSLTKERQLIRSTRETFDEDSTVKPLLLAGLLIQGGVLSYDTNVKSGGAGARYLGIGSSKEYREDVITITLRLVSVSTGEILIEVLVSKSIISVGLSQDIFRFVDEGTRLIEIEGGVAENESTSVAIQKAIEEGVLEIIKIGINREYWEYEKVN
jgi:curli production assembly/transport component CsgG